MRKLKLQVQMTVDGYIAGPHNEMDWLTFPWTDDIQRYVEELTAPVDTVVLGRKLAQGFIPHWAGVAATPDNPEQATGQRYMDLPKVVFTNTLDQVPADWPNTTLATDDLVAEITRLKNQAGQDLIAYGGVTFGAALIQHGLVDEFHLFVNSAAIGQGKSIFSELGRLQQLTLVKATPFDNGIVVLHYEPKHAAT